MEPFKYFGGNNHHHHHHVNHPLPDLPQRIIIDTDAAIDDALAILIYIFAEMVGLVKIEAITAGPGRSNQTNVQTFIMRILEAADRTDIPVYAGADTSLIKPILGPNDEYGEDSFGDLHWDTFPDLSGVIWDPPAAVAMGKMVTENPGEISIIGQAAFVNVALASKLFPTFMDDVKTFHFSGGNYKAVGSITWAAEYGFYLDPESIHILFEKAIGKKLIHLVTWEALKETTVSLDWRWNVLGAVSNPILDLITPAEEKIYPATSPVYNPVDGLAAACFLYPEEMITKQEILPASVELHGSQTRAQVVVNHFNNTTPNILFIESLNSTFFEELVIYAAMETQKMFLVKKGLKKT